MGGLIIVQSPGSRISAIFRTKRGQQHFNISKIYINERGTRQPGK
jgi:hypothetical protein